jgi:hypothetical protein
MPTPWCRIGKTKLGHREIGLDEKMIHVKYDDLGVHGWLPSRISEDLQPSMATQQILPGAF